MSVPVAIAETNRALRTGNKAMLCEILTSDVVCPEWIDLDERYSSLLVDGQARVLSIGKPANAVSFGDLADAFTSSIFRSGAAYDRIDVVFDRYRDESIKSQTRQRRSQTTRPIRRVVEGRDVPLPHSWTNFIALPENKADLACFLSQELLTNAPHNKEVVVAGGFVNEKAVKSSKATINLDQLVSNHEEADTRLVLHAMNITSGTVVVAARDTDVLLILLAHFPSLKAENIWMLTGTAKKRKYIPIRNVYEKMQTESVPSLLPFHALTGCDSTSYLRGHTKRSAWNVFLKHHHLLKELGSGDLNQNKIRSTEEFVCKVYGVNNIQSVNRVRRILFEKSCKPELMPPTSDALYHHIQRVHYQTMIWKKACEAIPQLPEVTEMGWTRTDKGLQPLLMSLEPIPEACIVLITCSFHTKCQTLRCKCRKSGLPCTAACGCRRSGDEENCFNDN